MSDADLIARLRHFSKLLGGKDLPEIMSEAADSLASKDTALAEIRAELENAKAELAEFDEANRMLVKSADGWRDKFRAAESERDEARKQRNEIGRAWDSADARAKEEEAKACLAMELRDVAEAEREALRVANAALADCLDCARQDWEGNNGEIIDKSDPHWTVEARRLCASLAISQDGEDRS